MDGPRHANKRYECIKWLVGKRDEYEIIRSTEIVQTCLEVSRRYPVLQCPGLTSWEDVENRMQQYKEMLEKYPGEMMCGKQSKYVKPHVLRKFFWALEEHFKIPIPNHIHMGDMEMMFPDFKEHMKTSNDDTSLLIQSRGEVKPRVTNTGALSVASLPAQRCCLILCGSASAPRH